MPDIFGKEQHQYDHLTVLRDAGLLDSHRESYGNLYGVDPKDQFRALGRFRGQRNLPGGDLSRGIEQNAQSLGFATHNLLAVQTMVDEVMYQRNRLDEMVTLNMDLRPEMGENQEGMTEYGVIVEDWAGEAEFADFYGSTAPRINISRRLPKNQLYLLGLDVEWTLEDIRNAAFTGMPLMETSVRRATEGTLNKMEKFAFSGDTRLARVGLVNIPTTSVTYNRTTAVPFSTSTPQVIREFVVQCISDIIEVTSEIYSDNIQEGLCIFLPVKQYNTLTSKLIGDNQERSIWASIQQDNPWTYRTNGNPIMLKSLSELMGAGNSGMDRMIVAVKDSRVYEMGVAFMPRVITTLDGGRVVTIPVEAKCSPIFFKRANSMLYYDGI